MKKLTYYLAIACLSLISTAAYSESQDHQKVPPLSPAQQKTLRDALNSDFGKDVPVGQLRFNREVQHPDNNTTGIAVSNGNQKQEKRSQLGPILLIEISDAGSDPQWQNSDDMYISIDSKERKEFAAALLQILLPNKKLGDDYHIDTIDDRITGMENAFDQLVALKGAKEAGPRPDYDVVRAELRKDLGHNAAVIYRYIHVVSH